MSEQTTYSVLLERDPGDPSIWVSHLLEYDIVSQGCCPNHALLMVIDATSLTLKWDETHPDLPDRKAAPSAYWTSFMNILKKDEEPTEDSDLLRVGLILKVIPVSTTRTFWTVIQVAAEYTSEVDTTLN